MGFSHRNLYLISAFYSSENWNHTAIYLQFMAGGPSNPWQQMCANGSNVSYIITPFISSTTVTVNTTDPYMCLVWQKKLSVVILEVRRYSEDGITRRNVLTRRILFKQWVTPVTRRCWSNILASRSANSMGSTKWTGTQFVVQGISHLANCACASMQFAEKLQRAQTSCKKLLVKSVSM